MSGFTTETVRGVEGEAVILARGELDSTGAPELERVATAALGAGTSTIVVDLSGVTFLDSAGTAAMRRIAVAAPGGLRLRWPRLAAAKFLRYSGLQALIERP